MMNLLQRSLRSETASANAPSTATSKPTKPVGTGVMGGLHNSGPLLGSSAGYSTNDHYFKTYDPHFGASTGYFTGGGSLSTGLPFSNLNTERIMNKGQTDACQKKHIHHTHQQHSQTQSQRTSAMSNYFDNYANYGKLFPSSCLQYLHQHNHLEEIIVAQQLFTKLDWSANNRPITVNYNDQYVDEYVRPLKAHQHANEFDTLTKYTYNDKQNEIIDSYTVPIFMDNQLGSISATHCPLNYEKNILGYPNSSDNCRYFRISFLETHIYQPQDIPSSPQHLPHHRGNSQQFMHNEWIKTNLENLRNYFPQYNEILVNVEKKAKFPFILFGDPGPKFNTNGTIDQDPFLIMPTATSISLSQELRITDGLFEVCDYALSPGCLLDSYVDLKGTKKTPLGYIISTYQTFPGEDNEKLEETWYNWTGASYLSRTLPSTVGLNRMLFFKRRDLHLLKSDCLKQFVDNELPIFTYVLLCELFDLKEAHLPTTCAIIDQLRARCCGYTALYINCT